MWILSPDRTTLRDAAGRRFDPARRVWTPDQAATDGATITDSEAVRWLQRESGFPCRPPVGVIGPREPTETQATTAETVGAGLAELGLTVLCGGRSGVMEAACRGVARAGGISVGLLPDGEWETANPYVTVPIATGIGVARNALIARASICLIAIGGGVGTLSEIAFGLQFGRPVFALSGAPQVAGTVELEGWDALLPHVARVVLAH